MFDRGIDWCLLTGFRSRIGSAHFIKVFPTNKRNDKRQALKCVYAKEGDNSIESMTGTL